MINLLFAGAMFLIAVAAFFVMVTSSWAEDFKTVPWKSFIRGVEFTQVEVGKWDFVYDGPLETGYTRVQVPAGILVPTDVYPIHRTGNKNEVEYVVMTDQYVALHLRDLIGAKFHIVNIRIVFSCVYMTDDACRQHLVKLLQEGAVMQSIGVVAPSREYQWFGILPPQGELVMGFFLNTAGKFAP